MPTCACCCWTRGWRRQVGALQALGAGRHRGRPATCAPALGTRSAMLPTCLPVSMLPLLTYPYRCRPGRAPRGPCGAQRGTAAAGRGPGADQRQRRCRLLLLPSCYGAAGARCWSGCGGAVGLQGWRAGGLVRLAAWLCRTCRPRPRPRPQRLLPPGVEVPSSFETVGHLAHLNLREELLPYKHLIGQVRERGAALCVCVRVKRRPHEPLVRSYMCTRCKCPAAGAAGQEPAAAHRGQQGAGALRLLRPFPA